jgi:hypothetical protein
VCVFVDFNSLTSMWALYMSGRTIRCRYFINPFFHGHIKLLTVSVFGRCIYQNLNEAMEKCIFVESDAVAHGCTKIINKKKLMSEKAVYV